jgi:hypothetical protein
MPGQFTILPYFARHRLTLHGHDPPLCRFELELRVDRNCEARRIARRQLLSPTPASGGRTRASKAVAAAAATAKLTLSRVLVNVSRDGFASNDVLGDAVLIHAHRRQNRQGARIDLGAPVRDDADDDCFAIIFVSFEKTCGDAVPVGDEVERSLSLTHPFSSHRHPRSCSDSARTSAGCFLRVVLVRKKGTRRIGLETISPSPVPRKGEKFARARRTHDTVHRTAEQDFVFLHR